MRVTVAAVGRDRSGPTRDLFEEYCRRCPWPIRLHEVSPRTTAPPERRRAEEAERLTSGVSRDAALVALDESGRNLTSRALADRVGGWQLQGRSELVFLIGGPDGLDPALLHRADLVLALGRMTCRTAWCACSSPSSCIAPPRSSPVTRTIAPSPMGTKPLGERTALLGCIVERYTGLGA